jgi:cobalt-zinc-cadmium resistance protein CzcA
VLARLIDLCLRHRGLVVVTALLVAAIGAESARRLPLDAFPDTTPVQVTVNTVAPALSPLEVEQQLTFPLEQALSGLPGLEEVRSVSKFGFSQVTAIFDDDTDVWLSRQVVAERVQTVDLPETAGRPSLGPLSTGLGEVFQYLVRGESLSPRELREIQDWIVRPQLLSVPGVAEVNSWGGEVKQYHVVVEPDRLLAHDLSLDDVEEALEANNATVGGGLVNQGGEAWLVQGVALATTIDEIAAIVIRARDGVPTLVGDVATVQLGHEIRRGGVTAEGRGEAVLGLGFMLLGENSREVTRRLLARLEEIRPSLPPGVTLEPVYARTTLVDSVLATVRENLFEGALLVIAVLFAFLGSVRAGVIVALAIPFSLLFAANAMLAFGIAGSLMSLGAIDFGLVVDSSVIQVENAAARLAADTTGRSVREIVRDAAIEVRGPTLFGELIIAIVYLPVLALEGVEGKLFRPMALTVVFALFGSMLLSLTLLPVLASLALRRPAGAGREPWLARGLARLHAPVLRAALRWRRSVLALTALAVVGAAWLAAGLGSEFVPRLREMAIVINTVRLAGVSLEESLRYGSRIESLLLDELPDEIAHVWTRTGTAEVATDPMGLELSDVFITLTPREQWTRARTQDELVAEMADVVEGLPGMRPIFTQPIEMRVNEMIAGVRGDVAVKLFGDDFETLKQVADEILVAILAVPGAADVAVEQVTGQPTLQVDVDRAALARHGVAAREVLEVVEALGQRVVGEVREGQRRFDLVVRLADRYRDDPALLGTVSVATPTGDLVPLSELARLRLFEGPSTITREWARRRLVVQANARGRDVGSFVADVRRAVAEIPLPAGYHVRYGGQFEHLERARKRLLLVVPLAIALILGLLYVSYGNLRDVTLVASSIPLAAVGGIVALWARGLPFSISAGVGFVALSGVAVLGEMVLVSRLRQLLRQGVEPLEAIGQAATGRLRAVLMTGLVAALGFVPMALNTGVGAEVQRPLATVLVGGVLTSTLTTLVVFPALYATFGLRGRGARAVPDEAAAGGE